MKLFRTFLLCLILYTAICINPSETFGTPVKNIFDIPRYPGTVETSRYPRIILIPQCPNCFISKEEILDHGLVTPNYNMRTEIYVTEDGSSLNGADVIAFFKEHYEEMGWKENRNAEKNVEERYIELSVLFTGSLLNRNQVQVSGYFSLWIAPNDGMIITAMKQSRITVNNDMDNVNRIIEAITTFSEKSKYFLLKQGNGFPRWWEYYKNEHLIDMIQYTLYKEDDDHDDFMPNCMEDSGINITILTYTSKEVAEYTVSELKDLYIRHYGERAKKIVKFVVLESTIVTIVDDSLTKRRTAKGIASKIEILRNH